MDVSKECDMIDSDEIVELKRRSKPNKENTQNNFATLRIYKRLKLRTYKPLVTLKAGFLLWMAASTSVMVYFHVYLKTRGLTIQDILLVNTVTSVASVLEIAALAVVVDKIGRSKGLLLFNIFLTGLLMLSITLIPAIPSCDSEGLVFRCFNGSVTLLRGNASCDRSDAQIQADLCKIRCPDSVDNHCDGVTNCEITSKGEGNISMSPSLNDSSSFCPDYVTFLPHVSELSCQKSWNSSCAVSCPTLSSENCFYDRSLLLTVYLVLSCFVMVAYSNVFRFLDIAIMISVKEHNSNYGEVRFWGIVGSLLGPALAGFVVHASTPVGEQANYNASFYLHFVLCLLTALVVCKVDIRSLDPGMHMWQKSLSLIRIPDVLIFALIIFVLGTSWGFNILYKNWYLADIGASSQVFSAVGTLSAFYGLPFLFMSELSLRKIGDTNMFVIALLAHAVHAFGYSSLGDAWLAVLYEVTSIFTYHLLWVAAMHFCHRITPVGLLATVNSTAGSIHFSVGRIAGSVFGGFLMNYFGGRFAYKILGIVNVSVALPYIMYLYCRKKRV